MAKKARVVRPQSIGAADFKAHCLELMDRVRETRAEYIVTKHGNPVAKLVPYDPPHRPATFFGSMRGSVLRYDEPFDPVPGDWLQDTPVNEES